MRPLAALAITLCPFLAACTVSTEGTARTVDARIDDTFVAGAEPPEGDERTVVTVWLVDGDRLVPVERMVETVADSTVAQMRAALGALFDGPRASDAAAGLRSAVPPDTELGPITLIGGVATVAVSEDIARIGGADEVRAVAQIVLTATESRDVTRVLLVVGGELSPVPLPGGALTSGPVSAEDYTPLVEP